MATTDSHKVSGVHDTTHPPTMPSPRRPAHGDFASAASHVAQSTPGFAAAMRGSEGSHGWLFERYAGIPVMDALGVGRFQVARK